MRGLVIIAVVALQTHSLHCFPATSIHVRYNDPYRIRRRLSYKNYDATSSAMQLSNNNIENINNNNSNTTDESPIQQQQQQQHQQQHQQPSRRYILNNVFGTSTLSLLWQQQSLLPCNAIDNFNDDTNRIPIIIKSQLPDSMKDLPIGLLESRVVENVLSYPLYGMEGSDIYYPSWFYGTWNVVSTTTDVLAPLGKSFFGTNTTYQNAMNEIGTSLQYEARFINIGNRIAYAATATASATAKDTTSTSSTSTTTGGSTTMIVADRGYNVQSIASAALGVNSMIDLPFVSPNKLSAIIAPIGSPNPIRVDLFTINRRQEYIDDEHFHCSEVVREIVSSVGSSSSSSTTTTSRNKEQLSNMSTILKEVETTTLYTLMMDKEKGVPTTIHGRQRSAKYLVPTQNDAASFRLYEMTRGKPVDVRYYNVIYTPKK